MNCEKARFLMNAYIDGELSKQDLESLELHMDSCDSCTVEFEELKFIVQTTGELELKELPFGFEEELHVKLAEVALNSHSRQPSPKSLTSFFKKAASRRNLTVLGSVAVLMIAVLVGKDLLGGLGSNDMAKTEASPEGLYFEMAQESAAESYDVEAPRVETISGETSKNALRFTQTDENEGYREGRLIIQSANIRLDIEKYDEKFNQIKDWVNATGGYVENESTSYKTNFTDRDNLKRGYLTLRIPASEFGRIIEDIKTLGNVISDDANAYDVTKQYRDTASEIENLKVTEARLREIMEQAQEVEDILAIENELTRIRGSINAHERQLKDWEALVDLTTVTVELNEVSNLKPVIEPIDESLWGKAKEGFVETINAIKKGIEKSIIWIVSNSPFLGFIALVAIVIQRVYKKRRNS